MNTSVVLLSTFLAVGTAGASVDNLFTGIPSTGLHEVEGSGLEVAFFVASGTSDGGSTAIEGIDLPELDGVVALRRSHPFWYAPYAGPSLASIPSDPAFSFADPAADGETGTGEVQFVLWRREDGLFGVYIPFANRDRRSYLRREGESLHQINRFDAATTESRPIALVAAARDPYQLVRDAADLIAREVPSFRVRTDKRPPEFIDLFGWCTWDAFYKDVTAEKVESGLRGFQVGGVQLGFLMIDDGWQRLRGHRFLEFATDAGKFPQGLSTTARMAKEEYGVGLVGVWHTLQGYWQGVVTEGGFAERFRAEEVPSPSDYFEHWPEQFGPEVRGFLRPDDVYRWYQEFYTYLSEAGIDMVKVDNQAMLPFFVPVNMGEVATMGAYQRALQGAAETHFQGNLINCMSNTNDIAFYLSASAVWRNSDDFYPRKASSFQADHVYHNALNNLWSSAFVWPDWDMFQTTHPHAEFHAMARAISGGPVYVSDKVGAHDFDIIGKLILSDGSALRLPEPAQPSLDSLFVDPRQENVLLKIFNRAGEVGVLGLFNCHADDDSEEREVARGNVVDTVRSTDVSGLPGERHVFYGHSRGLLGVRAKGEPLELELGPMESELVTIAPIENGVSLIGLTNKYLSPGAVSGFSWATERILRMELREGGDLAVYSEKRPRRVRANDQVIPFSWSENGKLLRAKVEGEGVQRIEIRY